MTYLQKNPLTLASRIFTIQFGDAILFAVHTVCEQGCMSISSVRSVEKDAEQEEDYSPGFCQNSKIRKPDQHLVNMLLVHAGAESQSQTLPVRKARRNKIHFYMVEEGTKENFIGT